MKVIIFLSILITTTVFAETKDNYIFVTGYGEEQKTAALDAKKQLALQLTSKIQVTEKNIQTKSNSISLSDYSSDSKVTTLPIEVIGMMVDSYSCKDHICKYIFKIDSHQWAKLLIKNINHNHILTHDELNTKTYGWQSIKRLSKIGEQLVTTKNYIMTLSAIKAGYNNKIDIEQLRLEREFNSQEQGLSISIKSGQDSLSSHLRSIISNRLRISGDSDLLLYIKLRLGMVSKTTNLLQNKYYGYSFLKKITQQLLSNKKYLKKLELHQSVLN
ncbi:hypothetical protein [Shewanella marina]|uniref:hypothetical protein n=1 Tax=Shewanella marina TaxID=487319 RepID=UPI0004713B66|nr:hypothetical protein [Shewanella marina]